MSLTATFTRMGLVPQAEWAATAWVVSPARSSSENTTATPTRALVLSQVFLSFGIPFALVPLVVFTRDRRLMGTLVNRPATNAAAYIVTSLIVGLNIYLLLAAIL